MQLSGTVVKRATLHNADIIEALDLYVGDMVFVEKGGEIIPKITAVDVENRVLIGSKITFITNCPECGSKLVRMEGEAAYYCPNEDNCPPQIKGKLEHFASRKAMNIDGLGKETIDLLYQNGLVRNISDFYKLKLTDLAYLERLGEKSGKNILEGLSKSKEVPFERLLFALCIRYVGETVAKKLANTLHNIDNIQNSTIEELTNIDEIGERIAESVYNYFRNEKNLELIFRLKAVGLQFQISDLRLSLKTNRLAGLKFVISGTFARHSRDELKKMIDENGGKNIGSVSSAVDYILAGENMGPSKLEKAQKMNIKIISEEEFLTMIEA